MTRATTTAAMTANGRAKILLVALAATAVVGASACRPDFAPYNRLTALRILAVKSEPAAPLTGESATWSALVYTLPDDPPPTYQWSWCPFMGAAGTGYACALPDGTPVDDAMLAALLPGQTPPALFLGTDATAQLQNFIDPTALMSICAGNEKGITKIDCSQGFPFQIKVQVTTTGAHPDTVIAVAQGHWQLDASTPANANPAITMLTATLAPGGDAQELTDDGALTFPRDMATRIHAVISMDAVQMYTGLDDNGRPAPLTERLFATWFVESGNTNDSRTSYYADRTPFEDLQKNTWTPAPKKDYAPDTARIFVVLHDNRGGVSWKQGTVNLDSTP